MDSRGDSGAVYLGLMRDTARDRCRVWFWLWDRFLESVLAGTFDGVGGGCDDPDTEAARAGDESDERPNGILLMEMWRRKEGRTDDAGSGMTVPGRFA